MSPNQSMGDVEDNVITMAEVNRSHSAGQSQQSREDPSRNSLGARSRSLQPTQPVMQASSGVSFQPCNLMKGEKVDTGLALCPFKLIQAYPHLFVGRARGEKASEWFRDNLFTGRSWDMYFIRDPYERRDPLILVPTAQLAQLLRDVNSELGFDLRIPDGQNSEPFEILFEQFPRPRFMGRIKDSKTYNNLKSTLGTTLDDLSKLDAKSLQLFKQKMDRIYGSVKSSKSKKDPEKQRLKMLIRQKSWGQTIKRVQRYLGLRQRLSLVPYSAATNAGWNVALPSPYKMESAVKFVCVDVEANEMNASIITEIGLAILDTKDIEDVPPGEHGKNWLPHIQAYHLRITEYRTFVNSRYVQGCPDSYNFGQSEFIARKDVCRRLGELIGESGSKYKSNIVMVGHDAIADLKYLQNLGYSMWDLDQLLDEIDTKDMFQRLQFSTNGRSLEFLCRELGMPGHHFHNAGNDAMYTLRAMLAMAVAKKTGGPVTESEKAGWDFDAKLEEWSDGEQDDGGPPVKSQAKSVPASLPAASTQNVIPYQEW